MEFSDEQVQRLLEIYAACEGDEVDAMRAVATAVLADHEAEMRALRAAGKAARDLLRHLEPKDCADEGTISSVFRGLGIALGEIVDDYKEARPTQAGEEGAWWWSMTNE